MARDYWTAKKKSGDPAGWVEVSAARRRPRRRPLCTQLCRQARIRGRKVGVPATITAEDLDWPAVCPILGTHLDYHTPPGQREFLSLRPENMPTLDRLEPAWGYVPGNVRVISHRANTLKSDATAAELRAVLAYIEREAI